MDRLPQHGPEQHGSPQHGPEQHERGPDRGRGADGVLVTAAIAGDPGALGAIYDRYADRLHDFCHAILRDRHEASDALQDTFVLAFGRLSQLRDPDKLRPWLYAIARHEALRRARARGRVDLVDTTLAGSAFEHEAMSTEPGPERRAESDDARRLVWDAAAGLNERDRVLLDLHLRQGLDGQDLGDAIGVPVAHAYVLLSRLRDQVERSLGALLVARRGRADCADLADLLRGWDGRFSPLMRKRVARHVDACDRCTRTRASLASPLALLATVPLVAAPPELRDRVLARALGTAQPDPGQPGSGQLGSGPRQPSSGDGGWHPDAAGFPPPLEHVGRRGRHSTGSVARRTMPWSVGAAAIVAVAVGSLLALRSSDQALHAALPEPGTGGEATVSTSDAASVPPATRDEAPGDGASPTGVSTGGPRSAPSAAPARTAAPGLPAASAPSSSATSGTGPVEVTTTTVPAITTAPTTVATTATTLPLSRTTLPPSTTTLPPSTTTLPPSTTGATTTAPAKTTTTLPADGDGPKLGGASVAPGELWEHNVKSPASCDGDGSLPVDAWMSVLATDPSGVDLVRVQWVVGSETGFVTLDPSGGDSWGGVLGPFGDTVVSGGHGTPATMTVFFDAWDVLGNSSTVVVEITLRDC